MIRVGVDVRALAKPNPTGVSRYTHELLSALAERSTGRPDLEYVLFGLDAPPAALSGYDRLHTADEPARAHSGLRAHCWEQFTLPRVLRGYDVDVLHVPAGLPPVLSGPPLVLTVHDISPVVHPEWFSRGYATLYRVLTPVAVRAADRIIAVSAFTRTQLVGAYPSAAGKTVVVRNGVSSAPASGGTPVENPPSGKFLLFVGAANPRKNLGTLLEAYRRYRVRVPDPATLVLAGPDREVFAQPAYDTPAAVRALGFVPDEQLHWLYRAASALVYPSLYEGFGLPVLEAMRLGTPVVTSDRGATAEIAGDAACLVDPLCPDRLADGIERAVHDTDYRDRLIERGRVRAHEFPWERAAARTTDVYRAVTGGRRPPDAPPNEPGTDP